MLVPPSQIVNPVTSLTMSDKCVIGPACFLPEKQIREDILANQNADFHSRFPDNLHVELMVGKMASGRHSHPGQPFICVHGIGVEVLCFGNTRRRCNQRCFSATNPSHSM